jgi:hypothetical protein
MRFNATWSLCPGISQPSVKICRWQRNEAAIAITKYDRALGAVIASAERCVHDPSCQALLIEVAAADDLTGDCPASCMYQLDRPQAGGSKTGVPGRRCQGWGGATRSPFDMGDEARRAPRRRHQRPQGARRPGTSDAADSAGTGN